VIDSLRRLPCEVALRPAFVNPHFSIQDVDRRKGPTGRGLYETMMSKALRDDSISLSIHDHLQPLWQGLAKRYYLNRVRTID